ncbi:hypothetical protein M0R45_002111 [Rubus argutus]|uniref:Uncharacterized protein n=1 Tax=Rubus argutus TaxID=59490 RepID=A0AAW1VE55_RUBAR
MDYPVINDPNAQKKTQKASQSITTKVTPPTKVSERKTTTQTRKSGNFTSDSNYPSESFEIPGEIPDLVDLYKNHPNVPQRRGNDGRKSSTEETKEEEDDHFLPKNFEIPGPIPDMLDLYKNHPNVPQRRAMMAEKFYRRN